VIRQVLAGALLAGALPLAAQDLSVTVGAARVRYADSLDGTAGAVGARVGLGHGLRAAVFDGAFSRFDGGGWALQLAGQGSLLWSAGRSLALGVAAGGSLNHYESGTPSGTLAVGPLLTWRTRRSQTVVGASAGAFRTTDSLWAALGSGSVQWYWLPGQGVSVGGGVAGSLADTLRFADATLHLRLATIRIRAGIHGGVRAGDLADGPWGSADLAWDAFGPVTIEAAAGRYPRDITGFTDGLYAQAGVRIYALRPPGPPPPPPVDVRRLANGRLRLELRYGSAADTLRIAGDWNGWVPVALTRRGGDRWTVELDLAPGAYSFALLDGDRWVLPRGMSGVDDGFGGVVGTLLVGR
jgi:hypothetical protein